MSTQTSTGMTFSLIAALPATFDDAGYAALAWVEVGELTDIPEYGSSTTVVEHNPLKTGVTEKNKGFINYGSTTLAMGKDASDAGQILLAAGNDGASRLLEHSFRIVFPDGAIEYTTGKIFSYTTAPGGANSIVTSNVLIEMNRIILQVP